MLDEYAAEVLGAVGGLSVSTDHSTIKVRVAADTWTSALATARDELGLGYLSFVSAIDWSNEVAVGDAPAEPVEERYEMLCAVGDVTDGKLVVFSADLPKDAPMIDSIVDLYPGAEWHEREAAEMFDITFKGLVNTDNLYLPPGFEGHPLQKSFALLARDVKPWPGDVDVEDLPTPAGDAPSTENPEA